MTQDDVTDVEIIEEEASSSSTPSTGSGQAEALLSLEELIKNHIDSIDKMRQELKQHREMFEDSFSSNPTYREHDEKVKEATKGRASVRNEISKQPSVAIIKQKVDDMRFDINEQSKTLSDLLQDYKDQTGANQIETRSGQMLEIVSTSKLVRRNTKPNN